MIRISVPGGMAPGGAVTWTIPLSSAVERLTYANGALWATLGESGAVARIDPTTNAVRRYDVGHFVTGVDARDGVVALGVQASAEDATASLTDKLSGWKDVAQEKAGQGYESAKHLAEKAKEEVEALYEKVKEKIDDLRHGDH